MLFYLSCVKKETMYFDFVDDFFIDMLSQKKIAVCNVPADLRRSETTNMKIMTKGLDQYTHAIACELEKARKCLKVMHQEQVQKQFPKIYDVVSPIRTAFRNKKAVNKDDFKAIKDGLGVDLLLFVERVTLHDGFRMNNFAPVQYKTTALEFQIWDLNNGIQLAQAKTSSNGDDVDNLFKDYNKKTAAVRIGKEIARELPKCQKK